MSLIQDVAGSGGPRSRSPARRRCPAKEGSRGLSPQRNLRSAKTGAALGTLFFVLVVNFFLFRLCRRPDQDVREAATCRRNNWRNCVPELNDRCSSSS